MIMLVYAQEWSFLIRIGKIGESSVNVPFKQKNKKCRNKKLIFKNNESNKKSNCTVADNFI